MISAAFVLALISIVVVTTLQRRANSTRDAQVMLGKIAGEVDALQSAPFDANGQSAAAQAAVRRHLRTSEQRIESRLAQLRRDHPSSHLARAAAPFRENVVTLNRIEGHVARTEEAEADALGPISGRQQRTIGRELGRAGIDYERHASRSLTFAMLGTTGMILALAAEYRDTTRGAAMLTGAGFALLEMAETIALTHHERWDGTGYPSGLSGPAIPLVGRIVAIAEVYDALTHSRPYKEAWTVPDALTEIAGQSGGRFAPDVVDAFLRVQPDLVLDTGEGPAAGRDHEIGSTSGAPTGAPAVAATPV